MRMRSERRSTHTLLTLALALGALAIRSASAAPATTSPSANRPSSDLAQLCDTYWQGQLKAHPTNATAIGDHRYDDRLGDISPAGIAAEQRRLQGVLASAGKIPEAPLNAGDRLTRAMLIEEVEDQL